MYISPNASLINKEYKHWHCNTEPRFLGQDLRVSRPSLSYRNSLMLPMMLLRENMKKSFFQQAGETSPSSFDLSITRVRSPVTAGQENRGFVCGDCDRTYKLKSSLRNHQKWECGKEPQFQCPYCPYKAKQKMHMGRHMERMHREIDYSSVKKEKRDQGEDEDLEESVESDYSSLLKSVKMEMRVDEDA